MARLRRCFFCTVAGVGSAIPSFTDGYGTLRVTRASKLPRREFPLAALELEATKAASGTLDTETAKTNMRINFAFAFE